MLFLFAPPFVYTHLVPQDVGFFSKISCRVVRRPVFQAKCFYVGFGPQFQLPIVFVSCPPQLAEAGEGRGHRTAEPYVMDDAWNQEAIICSPV